MPVFSRILGKVSRWELPSSHFSRREFSSPSLSSETNHELACDSGQDRSASRSLKDVAAPYGLFDQETEQSDSFATQPSEGRLGATRALKQSSSNCNSSDLLSGATNVLAPASSSPGATLSCLYVGNHNEQLGSNCESTYVSAPSGPTNVLAPASPSPGATLSCLYVGNHNEQSGSLCKSTYVSAPSGPTNVLAPASPSPGATLSCLYVGNHNEQSGSLCKSTYVSAPSGPAFTLAASSTTGATLSCLNVGVLNERLGSNRESDWILAQRGQRAPSPKTWAAENGNDPISSQSSTNETARATLNAVNAMSGCSASPTKNLDNKGATNYTNMSGKSASSAVKSYMGGTAASSTAKSVLTVIGGTAASSTPSLSHDSSSSVSVTVDTAQRLQRELCPNLSKNVPHDPVESFMDGTTASSTSKSVLTVIGGTAASSTPSQSHDSSSSVSVTVDTAQRLQRELCPNLSRNVTHDPVKSCMGSTDTSSTTQSVLTDSSSSVTVTGSTTSLAVNNISSSMESPAASSLTGTTESVSSTNPTFDVTNDSFGKHSGDHSTESAYFDCEPDHNIGDLIHEVLSSNPLETSSNSLYIPCDCRDCKCEMKYCSCLPCPNAWFNWRLAEKSISIPMLFSSSAMKQMLYGAHLSESVALQIFDIRMFNDWKLLLLQRCDEFRITLLCEQSGKVLFSPGISGGGKLPKRPKGPLLGRIRKRVKSVPVLVAAEADECDSDAVASSIDGEEIIPDENDPVSSNRTAVQDNRSCEVSSNAESVTDPVVETESQSKQVKYSDSPRRKASLKRYRSKRKGKAAQKKTYATYLSGVKGKAAKKQANSRYTKKEAGKAAKEKAQAAYFKKESGKAAKAKAQAAYLKNESGKAAKKQAQAVYERKEKGKIARKKANANFSSSNAGKAAIKAAVKTYSLSNKRRISRKRGDPIKKKYMKRYMRYYRECEKICVDFSGEDIPGNTRGLREHVVRSEFYENYQSHEAEILKCRSFMSEPQRYSASNYTRTAAACYKLNLQNRLSSSMNNLSNDSWVTIPGLSDKALKRIHYNPKNKASSLLAHLTWLKRQQCAAALKMLHHRLSSFADAVISKVNVQEHDSDQKAALLGLQCHQKMSEPYHSRVSFADGIPYNYEAEVQKFEESKKSEEKVPSHLIYRCNDNCIIPENGEDIRKLRNLFAHCSELGESNTNEFRRFLQKFQWCTKWHEFEDSEKNDLNPLRLYLFPVKHRNHPEVCYIPLQGSADSSLKHSKCRSQEVTLREFMVHYTNPRKFYSLISKAIIADKLMCDIDAATIMGDVEYLSKLVKINIQYEANSTVGFKSLSEAREWNHESIEKKMAEIAIQGKTPRTTFSYKDLYDQDRFELPSVRCYCCDRLITPVQSSTINLKTAKKLEYNPEKDIRPHQVFEDFQKFLVEKRIIDQSDSNESFESHPMKWLHGLTMCKSCRLALNKGEIPPNSLMNNMFTGETPEVLKVLNPIELMFVSRTKCFQTIVKPGPISSKLPQSERLNALKGNLIHLPLSTASTTKRLYGSAEKSETDRLFDVEDLVQLYGQPNKDKKIWNHIVDRKKVHAALTWLHENNPNYKDIIVPATSDDILPNVFGYICDLCQQDFDTENELREHEKSCSSDCENTPDISDDADHTHDKTLFRDKSSVSSPQENESTFNSSRHQSENESGPDSDVPCADGRAENLSATSESSSSTTNNCSQSDYINSDKPWIEQVPKNSLNNAFQHFSVVGNESNPERDTFKMLRIGSDPVPYYEPNLDCMAFPDRYPYGLGGLSAQREKNLTEAIFEQTRLMTWNNHQRRNLPYLFHLLAQKEKRLIKSAIFSVLNKDYKSLSKGDIEKGAIEQNPELLKRINSVLKNLPTQKEFWHDVKTKVEAMVFEFGAPTFWATFSPGEYDDEDMLKYLRERNSDLPGIENMTVSQLICKDPILASTYLQTKFDALLKHMLSKANPIGKIKHHFVRTEYQTRLMPHFHCIFWIEDAPLIGQNSDEEVLDFIGKHISCKMPNPNQDPIMYGLVKKFQLHKCNSYCLRRPKKCHGKARCKFGFPRAACLKPVLHGVASSIASHKTGSYMKRLYELQRNHNEKCVNDYNPILLYLWQGNVDMQFIGEKSESLVDYISKYATKAPRSEITDFDLNAMKNENKSTWAQLFQAASRLMKDREVGAMEARNFMLSENPIKTDATFFFINSVYASKRKSMLKSKKDLKSLPDDSTDIYYGDLIGTWYPKRPPYDGPICFKDMSLYEFASKYERIGNAAADKIRDKSVLLRLDGNAGFMKRRSQDPKKSLVIYGPSHLDPFKDSEAYYFSFLLLHKPFWHESLLMGSSDSYQKEFEKLKNDLPEMAAHEEKVRRKKNFREAMEKSAEAAANEMVLEDIDEQQNIDNASDVFETIRKQSSIENEEQLNEAVAGLSPDQLTVYNLFVDNVNHYYQHKSQNCSCEKFEPIRLFVSGFGGSGKSHLIRTLMAYQYIRSEIKKDPCHLLLGAPTGIASHNIGGMTLHSMWNLPVDHSNGRKNSAKEYRRLKPGQVNIMRANYAHACGMIVDEVSMISNQMLMAINMRMNEVLGSNDPVPFGGMPVIVFGDLFQLEPVSGSQPFIPLTSNVAKKMFGGFPCAPNIWEGFKFRQLNTNHRQKGDDNIKWRTTLDHIRFGTLSSSDVDYLNERMIDTSGCKLRGEFLECYVAKFLECEHAGLGPVCLLPENKMVEEFNAAVMQKKGEIPAKIIALDKLQCPKDKQILVRKLLSGLESNETGGLESCLNLAINTRVMLRVNDKRTPGLVNGARGTVQEIVMDSSGKLVTKVLVKFDGIEKIQAIERIERKFQVHPRCYVYRKMFPLINSYAMTIHKSQSLSLPCVFADLGDKIFADGMTYVAVSRCLKHNGLYLMNFNPAKVVASEKACREYSRLLGKGQIHHNHGCKTGKLERFWYTTSVVRKATKVTADKIRQTASSKGTSSDAASNVKNVNHTGKRKFSVGNESLKKKAKSETSEHPSNSSASTPDKTKSKQSTPKIKVNPTLPAKKVASPEPSDVVVTHESLGMNRPFFDYIPVDETWQRSICNAFGWRFLARSRGANVHDLHGVMGHIKPKASKTEPDGNCWYRAVASIVIGNERFWRRIKDAVLDFMTVNISVLQNMYNSDVNLLARDNVIDAPIDSYFAERLIDYYKGENIWVNNVVMEFTAIMLNTRWYLYTPIVDPNSRCRPYWSSVEDTYFWSVRQAFTSYPARVDNSIIPDLTDQSMYVNWKNRDHFEPCQNGLNT